MRAGPGIDVTNSGRWTGHLLRTLVGLLTVLALLTGSGAGRQAALAQGSGGNAGADSAAMDDEEVSDERDRGIDIPFTSRDDDESGDDADDDGSAFALTAYNCTPGDDTGLRDRMLVESSTDPDAFFEDGIDLEELRAVCSEPAEELTYTLTDIETGEHDARGLGGDDDPSYTWTNLSSTGSMYTLGVDAPETYADPIVKCTVDGDPPGTVTQYFAVDGVITFYSAIDRGNSCEWFNVDLGDSPVATDGGDGDEQGDSGATPDDGATPAGGAAIRIQSYTCTPGDDTNLADRIAYQIENWISVDPVQGITLDELRDTCDPTAEEITFTVNNQDSGEDDERVLGGEENEGYFTWGLNGDDGYSVDADEPAGYGEPIVFCVFHDTGDPAEDLSPSPMADGVLNFGMSAGTTFTCDWFNVDLGASVDSDADSDGVEDGNEVEDGTDVDNSSGDGATSGQTAGSGGSTSVTDGGEGNYAVRAYICTPEDDAQLLDRITYQTENWTTVDPVVGITIDELREECEPPEEAVTLTVIDGQTGVSVEQDVEGEDYVSWDLQPLMSYTISADEPAGYVEPIVFCAFDDGEPSQSPIIDGNHYLLLGEGVTNSCEWFLIDPGDSAA